MAVPIQPVFTQHVGNGVTKPFAFQFLCQLADDLTVFADGAVVSPALYALTGLAQIGGGTVTFVTAPGDGVKILLWLNVKQRRSTQYPPNGDLQSKVVNADFDRLWLAMQGAFAGVDRSIKAPIDETLGMLPPVDDRLGRALIFNKTTGDVDVSEIAFDDQIDIVSDLVGDAADQVGLAQQAAGGAAVSEANAADSAVVALDAASQLQDYIQDGAVGSLTFPFDMGLIVDPVVAYTFDLGNLS